MLRTSLFTRLFSRDVFQANHARCDDEPESRAVPGDWAVLHVTTTAITIEIGTMWLEFRLFSK